MYKDLSLKEKAKVIREGVRLGLTSIDDILSLYDDAISHKFAEGSIATPDWDPNNPYHYHTASGEKVVITPEDWEKHKGLPYFKLVEDAVLTELAAHPGPEYIINPKFSEDLRMVYKGNMGPKYLNYSSFYGNLPQGYSFTPEGLVLDNQGNLYVLKGFRQTPRFTYDENNPLVFPVLEGRNQGSVTFYPVNMEKTIKPSLPVSSIMNVDKEHESAIRKAQNQYEYPVTLWDILPTGEGVISTYDNVYSTSPNYGDDYSKNYLPYKDKGAKQFFENYISNIIGREIKLNGPSYMWDDNGNFRNVYADDVFNLSPKEFNLVKKKLKEAKNRDYEFEKKKTEENLNKYKQEGLLIGDDEEVYRNSIKYYEDWINQDNPWLWGADEDRSPKPRKISRKEAEKRAVVEVGPLQVNNVLTYAQGGPIVSPYGQWKYPGRDTIIPSNNITMDNVNYPVLGVSDTGDTKIMMPWNDYKFRGSIVYEHPLIGNLALEGKKFNRQRISDDDYFSIMEKVALENNAKWNKDRKKRNQRLLSVDEELVRLLNSNDYDYRGYYTKYPNSKANADTHWTDEFKTVYHPTFSEESRYSGTIDRNYNPYGYIGGSWGNNDEFIPAPWLLDNQFQLGGLAKLFSYEDIPDVRYLKGGHFAQIGRKLRLPNRINRNTSSTLELSEDYETEMRLRISGADPQYPIPYIPDKSILINGSTTSTNVLDSIVKYAGIHNRDLKPAQNPAKANPKPRKIEPYEAIGLGILETHLGAIPSISIKRPSKATDDEWKLMLRAWYNANQFTAYGDIPSYALLNNYHWLDTNGSVHPLLDAIRYYSLGDYNTGDKNHTSDVKNAGLKVWRNLNIQDWWNNSGKYVYEGKPTPEQTSFVETLKADPLNYIDGIFQYDSFGNPIKALGGNLFKKGGIYIKPENRGKFTALKKRTGHSASWFKAHGTPALKKMATFALNARHWNHKHDEGGHLFLEDGQIFKRPLDDLTGRNILTSPILPPKSYYEQFTISELEPKKPQLLQPLEGTYGNKYSELISMNDGTYVNNPINKGLQLDWRTHTLEFAPFLAIGAGPAIGSTATWLATSKPALYNLGRMTLGSEIGGRGVDLASNLFTGNTWGLNVGNVVEGITGWNPNNTIVGLFVTDATNPGYTMNWWDKVGNLRFMSTPVVGRIKNHTTNYNEPIVSEYEIETLNKTLSKDTKNLRRKLSKGLLSKILQENGNIRPLSGENRSLTFTNVHPRKAPYYIEADVPIESTLEGVGSIANFDKKPFSTRYKLPKDYSLNIYDDNVKVYRKNGNKYDLVDKEFLFNTPELRFDLINSNKKFRNTKDLKLSDHHIVLSEPPIQTLKSSTFYLEDIIPKDEMFRLQYFNPNFVYKEYYGDIFPDANLNSDEYATMLKNAIRNTDNPSKIAEDVGILAQRFYTNKYGVNPYALSEQEWSNLGQSILEKQRQLGNNVFFHSTLNEPFSNIDNLKLNLVNNGFLGKGFYLSDLPSSDYGPVVLPFSFPQGKQVILTKGNNRLRADIKEVDDFLKGITKSRFKWTKEGFKEKPYGYWPGIQLTSRDPEGWNNLIKDLDFDLVKSKESSKGIGLTYPEILIPPDKTYKLEMLFKNPSLMKHGGFIYS